MYAHFAADTAVTASAEPGVYAATIGERWWVVRGPNGGYLAAMLVRAMQARTADPARTPRSVTVHYLEAPAEGDVTIETTIERAGRGLTTVTARMRQQDRTIALALGAFASARTATPHRFNDKRMPDVPPPSDVERRPFDSRVMPPVAGQLEVRPTIGPQPWSGHGGSTTGGWLRLAEPEPTIDHAQLAFLTDAWVPAMFNRVTLDEPVAVPTVDLTIHFREALDDTRYVLAVFSTQVAADGFIEEDGEIWSEDGRLLAQSRQLAVVVPVNASSTSASESNHS